MEPNWITSKGENLDVNGTDADWLYMGFKGLHGTRIGSAIFISDITKREGEAWYLTDQAQQPFYYFSPAHLFLKPLTLPPQKELQLNYRIVHLAGEASREMLESEYEQYLNKQSKQ